MNISPSQVKKKRQCDRLIGFEYVEGRRPPSSIKQRFGTNVHTHLENWLKHGTVPPDTPEGLTAKQGIRPGWLPTPGPELLIEHHFAFHVFPEIKAKGIIDCVEPPTLLQPMPVVIDHKSTSNMRYAMTVEELRNEPQSLIYSAWAMLKWNAPEVCARWVYYAASNPKTGKRKPAGARPVETIFRANDPAYLAAWAELQRDIAEIYRIRASKIPGNSLKPNPGSCSDYGGCPHSPAQGGTCELSGADYLGGLIECT